MIKGFRALTIVLSVLLLNVSILSTVSFALEYEYGKDQSHLNDGIGLVSFLDDSIKTEPKTTEPETTEPETMEPETTEPDTTDHETTEPETTEPETTEPETTEPETTEPETTEPETTEPETTESETTEPETTEPVTTEPETTEPETTEPETTEPEELPDEPDEPDPMEIPDEKKVRIGLSYGSAVTVGYETFATNGYYVGLQTMKGDNYSFSYLWTIHNTNIAVIPSANITKKSSTYSFSSSKTKVTIGGFHIILNRNFDSKTALLRWINEKNILLDTTGYYAYPALINGKWQLRIGSFSTSSEAANNVSYIMSFFPGYSFSIASPVDYGLTVIDTTTSLILFEYYSTSENYQLGLTPIQNGENEVYTKNNLGLIYKGVFTYQMYMASGVKGVSVTNVLPIEDYVMGVIPYEVNTSWNLETLKAFSIVVRTYTLTNLNKHNAAYGFDLCNTSNCQVYKGMKSVTQSVIEAVNSTKGEVVTYKGNFANCYYSASIGGVSCYASDVWGGTDYPYLIAQLTPWEKYLTYSRGFWIHEIDAVQLAKEINNMGYSSIKDEVAEIRIDEYCRDSTYVKTITIVDIHKNELTITGPSRIRSVLTSVLYSANFVVGKNEVRYSTKVYLPGTEPTIDEKQGTILEEIEQDSAHLLSALGDFIVNIFGASVASSDGIITNADKLSVIRVQGSLEADSVFDVAKAEGNNSFVFVGKGWGHGVGMSQYGAKDLGDMGYSAYQIISTYFPGVTISDEYNGR